MNRVVQCPISGIDETLRQLRGAGKRGVEHVVLWLAKPSQGSLQVERIYTPAQQARKDNFVIPRASMGELMSYLRQYRLMVAAQVHSHPGPAFHSKADDEWAIVRHKGALSIVIPDFAVDTTLDNFADRAAFFEMSFDGQWAQIRQNELASVFQCV